MKKGGREGELLLETFHKLELKPIGSARLGCMPLELQDDDDDRLRRWLQRVRFGAQMEK